MTYPFAEQIRKTIHEQILKAKTVDTAVGTCVTRATTGSRATVTFDGDTLAVPVKVLAHIDAQPGDRVVMQVFGSEWVVVGTFTQRGPSRATVAGNIFTGNTTSGSYVDMTGVSTTWTKRYDGTTARVELSTTASLNGTDTITRFGVRINGVDYDVTELTINGNLETETVSGTAYVAAGLPAGVYTVQGRWKRTVGAATVNAQSWTSLTVTEVW